MNNIANNLETSSESTATSSFLTSTSKKLEVEAAEIQLQAKKNRRLIDKGLRIVYILPTFIISLNLVAVIALSGVGLKNSLCNFCYKFIILLWFLTVLCWFFFGMSSSWKSKFSGDTCTALENFQQNPNNNSFSSILPCDELLSAKSVLFDELLDLGEAVGTQSRGLSQDLINLLPTSKYKFKNLFSAKKARER
ncbi:hypothetical protein SO802_026456 [Lithocarpus litseifolius]|uniref:Transmembrane protein n=1 Tax=Lithocarpus litseifolius TaxID=425828 RepID=A0AAW2BZP5_9ROSI